MDDPEDVYPLLKSYEGRPAGSGRGKDPVNAPMIRHWCEAMGDANPAYAGADPVAPPTMLQVWTMGGLSGPTGRAAAYGELLALLDSAGCTAVVATDCEQEYLRPLRPGHVITFDSVIESVSPRKTTKLGAGHFVTTRTDIRADGEPAGTHRFRIFKYAPAKASAKASANGSANASAEASVKDPGESRAARPRPVVNRDNAGFWDGVAERRLLIQRCDACGALRFPWLPGCGGCGSPEWTAVEASGAGTVFSYVVVHHPPFPAFDPPYAVALIELAEGVRMISNISGVPHDRVRIGMPEELEFVRVDGGQLLPVFRAPASQAAL
ncbi:bifunctional MaoC family dehydratase N-terminal/OB-fold nucleic acid binding domain-containing protein [Streptomyces olivoreticuli]